MTGPIQASSIRIDQIYLDEATFRHRPESEALPPNTAMGEIRLDLSVEVGATPGTSAARTRLTIASDPEDTKHPYQFLVRMVVAVSAIGDGDSITPLTFAQTNAVATLVPFVREAIANITMRGRFGPVWINPVAVTSTLLTAAKQRAASTPHEGPEETRPTNRERKRKRAP